VNQIVHQAKRTLSGRRDALWRVWRQRKDDEQQLSGGVEKDWVDVATDREVAEVLHVLSEKEERELEEIDAALARVADGSYGVCQRCSRAIGRQRLLAIPEARHCLECSGIRELPR
jgi:DnaK suppressor protein